MPLSDDVIMFCCHSVQFSWYYLYAVYVTIYPVAMHIMPMQFYEMEIKICAAGALRAVFSFGILKTDTEVGLRQEIME